MMLKAFTAFIIPARCQNNFSHLSRSHKWDVLSGKFSVMGFATAFCYTLPLGFVVAFCYLLRIGRMLAEWVYVPRALPVAESVHTTQEPV
jgi:hypothetical protein